MVNKDWLHEAASEIDHIYGDTLGSIDDIKAIIVKHSPFKPDVAYMPVPRCDQCAHWVKNTTDDNGTCYHGVEQGFGWTTPSFGCVQWKAKS